MMFSIKFQRFCKAEDGSQTVVFVVMLPLLVWSIMAMMTFTDAFRTRAVATDATAVIADSLSRQTIPINMNDLRGLVSVAEKLTGSDVSLRVTQLRCTRRCNDSNTRELQVDFSHGIGLNALNDRSFDVGEQRARVPLMIKGDRLVLVETSLMYEPIARIGLEGREVLVSHSTRMRFTPQLCWERCSIS